jgi:F-box-like
MNCTEPHSCRLPLAANPKERIRQLEAHISDLKTESDPFRRLPLEILCEIAQYAIALGDSPLNLNQVCSSMRAAINGMKSLWANISIGPSPSSPVGSNGLIIVPS